MPPNMKRYYNQNVSVQRIGGTNDYGEPTYLPAATLRARKRIRQQRRTNDQGQEILSSTEVWMDEELQPGDLIDGEAVVDRENMPWLDGRNVYWAYFL